MSEDHRPSHDVQEGWAAYPDIKNERRSQRRFVRVSLPMDALFEGERHTVNDVSVNGFSVFAPMPGRRPGDVLDCELIVRFHGFTTSISVGAKLAYKNDETKLAGFEFVEASDTAIELLGSIIRAHIAGQIVTVDELLAWQEGQTARTPTSLDATAGSGTNDPDTDQVVAPPFVKYLRYTAFGVAALMLVLILAFMAYDRLFVVRTSFAAITAPMVELHAPISGQLTTSSLVPGDRVDRDRLLGQIQNLDLEAELASARVLLVQREQMLADLPETQGQALRAKLPDAASASQNGVGQTTIAAKAIDEAGSEPVGSTTIPVNSASMEPRIRDLSQLIDLQRMHIKAIESRVAQNLIYSPCVCIIRWARGGMGGEWVRKDDLLFVLVSSAPEDVLVEARVPLKSIDRIELDQEAFVRVPNHDGLIRARVTEIVIEGEQQPRAGFPAWVRKELSHASVLLALDDPEGAQKVGMPVDVRFPLLSNARKWQGLETMRTTITGWFD